MPLLMRKEALPNTKSCFLHKKFFLVNKLIDGGFYGIDLKQIKSKAFSAVSGPDGSALQYKKKFTKIRVPGGSYGDPKVAPKGVTLQKMVFERGVQSIRNDLIRLETLS